MTNGIIIVLILLFIRFCIIVIFFSLHRMVCTYLNIYVLQRIFSHLNDFNNRNKVMTAKLLTIGYRYHKLRKAVVLLTDKYKVSFKTHL